MTFSFGLEKKWDDLTESELEEVTWRLHCLSFDSKQLMNCDKLGLLRSLTITAENRDYWLARAHHAEAKLKAEVLLK